MKTVRDFWPTDRYIYDFKLCSTKDGWAQIDTSQDAHYYGTWANPEKLVVISYCEGDVTTNTADTPEEFVAEIRQIKEWNDENGHRFIGIDPGFNEELKRRFVDLGLADLLH